MFENYGSTSIINISDKVVQLNVGMSFKKECYPVCFHGYNGIPLTSSFSFTLSSTTVKVASVISSDKLAIDLGTLLNDVQRKEICAILSLWFPMSDGFMISLLDNDQND
jgi:hypothetical protein